MVSQLGNVSALLRIKSQRLNTQEPSKKGQAKPLRLPADVVTLSDVGRKQAVAKAVADRLVQELTRGKGGNKK
jgi:hypothetical protein